VVVTNTTFRLCPWADALFAFDLKWWRAYHCEVMATFQGQCFSGSLVAANRERVTCASVQPWFRSFRNSGACAVSLAISGGAARVVLVGFDADAIGGRTHWHGDHPRKLGNLQSISDWPRMFGQLAKYAKDKAVDVVNASRHTRLDCFPRGVLEDSL
jgi:hypothetical protein